MRKLNPFIIAVFAFVFIACSGKKEQHKTVQEEIIKETKEESIQEKAQRIHKSVISIDTHDDIDSNNFTETRNYTQDLPTQVTLKKMRDGGLDAVFFVVFTPQKELNAKGYKEAYDYADAKFKAIHRLTEEIAPDQIELATTSEDIRRIHKEGKLVALIGVENGYPMGEDLSKLQEFYDRGARYFSVAHNGHSQLGDSNTGEKDDIWLHDGLSDLGKKVITELNRLGIMIDLSHPSIKSNRQAIKLSKAPVIASHSSARALNDVSRNLWDEDLKAVAASGGVVQAVAFPDFVNIKKADLHKKKADKVLEKLAGERGLKILEWEEISAMEKDAAEQYLKDFNQLKEDAKLIIEEEVNPIAPPVNIKDFVDHIDYMVKLIGVDHVGISSDFDGGGGVEGWNDASETFNVTLELVKRGYSEEDIKKMWGENLMRVMDEVQKVAKEIQEEDKK